MISHERYGVSKTGKSTVSFFGLQQRTLKSSTLLAIWKDNLQGTVVFLTQWSSNWVCISMAWRYHLLTILVGIQLAYSLPNIWCLQQLSLVSINVRFYYIIRDKSWASIISIEWYKMNKDEHVISVPNETTEQDYTQHLKPTFILQDP